MITDFSLPPHNKPRIGWTVKVHLKLGMWVIWDFVASLGCRAKPLGRHCWVPTCLPGRTWLGNRKSSVFLYFVFVYLCNSPLLVPDLVGWWRNPTWRKPEVFSQHLLSLSYCLLTTLSSCPYPSPWNVLHSASLLPWRIIGCCVCVSIRLVSPGPPEPIWRTPPVLSPVGLSDSGLPGPETKSSHKMTRTKVAPKLSSLYAGA